MENGTSQGAGPVHNQRYGLDRVAETFMKQSTVYLRFRLDPRLHNIDRSGNPMTDRRANTPRDEVPDICFSFW